MLSPNGSRSTQNPITSQAAIFSFQYALVSLLNHFGVQPAYVMGHSLGQYAAAVTAGIIALQDAIKLVYQRAVALNQIRDIGTMLAVNQSESQTRALLAAARIELDIAALNSPEQTVVSGGHLEIEKFKTFLSHKMIHAISVGVSFPFHSRYVDAILSTFSTGIGHIKYNEPAVPMQPVLSAADDRFPLGSADYWAAHLRRPVDYKGAIINILNSDIDVFIEIGAGGSLASQLKATIAASGKPELPVYPVGSSIKEGAFAEQLRRLYLTGLEIKFRNEMNHDQAPLPAWPYARKHAWLTMEEHLVLPREKEASTYWTLKTTLPDGSILLEKSYRRDELQNLSGHRIGDVAVIPAAEYIHLIEQAVAQLDCPYSIEHFSLPTTLVKLNLNFLTAQLRINLDGDPKQVTVHLRNSPAEPWIRLAEAKLAVTTTTQHVPYDLSKVSPSAKEDQLEFYNHLEDIGFQFCGALRSLEYIARIGEGCIGYYRSNTPPVTPIGVLDLPFQCLSFVCRYLIESVLRTNSIFVPMEVSKIKHIHGDLHPAFCVVHVVRESETEIYFDSTIYDQSGMPLHQYENAKVVRISLPFRVDNKSIANDVYVPHWVPSPLDKDKILDIKSNVQYLCLATGDGDIDDLFRYISDIKSYPLTALVDLREAYADQLVKSLSASPAPVTLIIEKSRAMEIIELAGVLRELLQLLNHHANFNREICIVILTKQTLMVHPAHPVSGLDGEAITALIKTLSYEAIGITFRVLDVDRNLSTEKGVAEVFTELNTYYVTRDQARESVIALRSHTRYIPELNKVVAKASDDYAPPCKLTAPLSHYINDLRFQNLQLKDPAEHEVQVKVSFTGVNFRDVLRVLGQYPSDDRRLGCEFSGVVTRLGANVSGLSVGQPVAGIHFEAFASHLNVTSTLVAPINKTINLALAASLPVCALSVAIPLDEIVIPPQSSVLIHSTSGGLGSFALQYFVARGHAVYATSHGDHKKHYLLSKQIVGHGDSRGNDFKNEFLAQGPFHGVWLALFTLPKEALVATLECIQPGGYLIDYTKNTESNRKAVLDLRPDVHYLGFDLEDEVKAHPEKVCLRLHELFSDDTAVERECPITSYPASYIKEALHRMTSANHIGKVVVHWDQTDPGDAKAALITGGSGFLAEQLALYYVHSHEVILTARTPLKGLRPSLAALIARHQNIHYIETDIADYPQVERLFQQLKKEYPPLDIIVHAAGTLNNGIFLERDEESFRSVYQAKCAGARNLHLLSRDIPLSQFVLLSSIAALLGSPGQANYASANGFLVNLCRLRCQQGLPGKALLLGPYSGTRMVSEMTFGLFSHKNIISVNPIDRFIAHYDYLVSRPEPVLIHSMIRWGQLSAFFVSHRIDNRLFRKLEPTVLSSANGLNVEVTKYDLSGLKSEEALRTELEKILIREIVAILEPPATFTLNLTKGLKEQGIDSLVSVELSAAVGYKLDIDIPASLFASTTTPNEILDFLMARFGDLLPK